MLSSSHMGSLETIATLTFSSLPVRTWNSGSGTRLSSSMYPSLSIDADFGRDRRSATYRCLPKSSRRFDDIQSPGLLVGWLLWASHSLRLSKLRRIHT